MSILAPMPSFVLNLCSLENDTHAPYSSTAAKAEL